MKEQLDNETLAAFTRRDPDAFKVVFDLFYIELRYFIEKVISDAEEAQDITSETFTKLYKRCDRFETLENIKAFLFITARNNCLDFLRYKKRMQTRQKELQQEMDARLGDEGSFINRLIEAGVTARIYEEVERLPTECKKVFKLLFYECMEQSEVATRLGINISTVRSQKSRALQLLRVSLSDKEFSMLLILSFSCLTRY